MIKFDELQKSNFSELPIDKQIEAFYKGTDALAKFSKAVMIPIIDGQFKFNAKERAVVGIYYRMYAWIKSMVAMNGVVHFQGSAAAVRSLFELLIDIKMLEEDEAGENVEKFHAFPGVERFKVAEKLVDFCDKYKGQIDINSTHQRNFINKKNKRQEIEQSKDKCWGRDKKGKTRQPKHWSGKDDIRKRAQDLGLKYEKIYMEIYPQLSWQIHSGSAGYAGLKEEHFKAIFLLCNSNAQKIFLEATTICANLLKITIALDWFKKAVEDLSLTSGRVLVEEQIKILENMKSQNTVS